MTTATRRAAADATVLTAARIHDGDRLRGRGWAALAGGLVHAVGDGVPPAGLGPVHDLGDALLVPGLVDVHCHGGGGAAFDGGRDAAAVAAAAHLTAGTTSVVASLVTDEVDALAGQLGELVPACEAGDMAGIHLEGPWLSPAHRGAHRAASLRPPTPEAVDRLLSAAGGHLRQVTLAPELPGALAAVRRLVDAGVVVAVGHTDATYEQTRAAVDAGARLATHLHNACRPVHHREPGPAVALLEDPRVRVEAIVDGVHLHPAVVRRIAREAAGRWLLVSDAMAAACCGDGTFSLGPLTVRVQDGVVRVVEEDGQGPGAIAGSTTTVSAALRTAVQAGVPLDEAVRAASSTPADALGLGDVGRLRPGARADAVVLDAGLAVRAVMRRGVWRDVPEP